MTTRLALAASTLALLAAAPAASAAPVTGGKLDWTMVNHYVSGDDGRTMLGYFLDPRAGAGSQGDAKPTAPATLTDAFGNLKDGVAWNTPNVAERAYTLGFPVASGDYAGGAATIELSGRYTFTTHGIPITFVDPLVTLSGTTGTLKGSGETAGGPPPAPAIVYDRSKTQFDLDLSNATIATGAGGAKVISGITPVGTADTFFSFGPGKRNYGTMTLTLDVTEPQASPPKDGAQGPAGAPGRSALIRTVSLKRAPFAGKGEHRVKLLDRRSRAVIATGTVKKRTLRVMYLDGTALKGSFTLRLSNGKVAGRRQATVSIG